MEALTLDEFREICRLFHIAGTEGKDFETVFKDITNEDRRK